MKFFKNGYYRSPLRRVFPLFLVFLLGGLVASALAASGGGRHHGRHSRHGGQHGYRAYHHSPSRYYYGGYGLYGYGGYWGYPYGYGRSSQYYRSGADSGAIDLNVTPKKAAVYVDGQLIGKAGKFDGFPDYLWLPKGSYELIFYLDGYETVKKTFSIYPGMVFDLELRLQPGEATAPEKLSSPVVRNRGERRSSRPRERVEPRPQRESAEAPPQRYRNRTMARARSGNDGESYDMRSKPATLWLSLEPSDASVYLDGQFIGTGESLSRAPDGLLLDPGDHELEIIRPGYRTQAKTFQIGKGETLDLNLELEAEEP